MADITGGFIIQRLTQKFLINRPLRKFVGHQSSAGLRIGCITAWAVAGCRFALGLAGGLSVVYIICKKMAQLFCGLFLFGRLAHAAFVEVITFLFAGCSNRAYLVPLVSNIPVRDGAGLYAAVFLATTSGAGQGLYAVFRAGRFFRLYPVCRVILIRELVASSLSGFNNDRVVLIMFTGQRNIKSKCKFVVSKLVGQLPQTIVFQRILHLCLPAFRQCIIDTLNRIIG